MTRAGRDAEMLAGDRRSQPAAVEVGRMPGQYAMAGQLSAIAPEDGAGPSSGAQGAEAAVSSGVSPANDTTDGADPSTWWG